jgi:transposase
VLVAKIMEIRPHVEQGFNSCMGVMRLGEKYSPERLEAACARAVALGAYSYKNVKNILEKGLDRQQLLTGAKPVTATIEHENIRGPGYYH